MVPFSGVMHRLTNLPLVFLVIKWWRKSCSYSGERLCWFSIAVGVVLGPA